MKLYAPVLAVTKWIANFESLENNTQATNTGIVKYCKTEIRISWELSSPCCSKTSWPEEASSNLSQCMVHIFLEMLPSCAAVVPSAPCCCFLWARAISQLFTHCTVFFVYLCAIFPELYHEIQQLNHFLCSSMYIERT